MTRLPMLDPLAEIRRIYFATTRQTIERDLAQALDLLKTMGSEEERSRATVFMHGLAEMRKQWGTGGGSTRKRRRNGTRARRPKPP